MKKSILVFLLTLGIAGSVGADTGFSESSNGPTQEEYEAALIIVQRYMAEEETRTVTQGMSGNQGMEVDAESYAIDFDGNMQNTMPRVVVDPGVVDPGFRVFGSANIEAASITAVTADDNDGSLMVGHPYTNDQTKSGRLVFHENFSKRYMKDLCGFQFAHNGNKKTLTLEVGCVPFTTSPVKTPPPLVIFDRTIGEPIMFKRSLGIGGTLFDGSGSGTRSGGNLVFSFDANSALSCDDICRNHQMNCTHAQDLKSPYARTNCGWIPDLPIGMNPPHGFLCMCNNAP